MLGTKRSPSGRGFVLKFAALVCAFAAGTVFIGYSADRITSPATASPAASGAIVRRTVVIDPGHGGEDGGAVASDGTLEKDLNLAVSQKIHRLCGALGISSVMTREDDVMLYDKYGELEDYGGKKKSFDLKNRVRFTKEAGDDAIFLGIHMNRFTDPKYSGAQVYYSKNDPDSAVLADMLRRRISTSLQVENTRETKKADSSIFVLKQLHVPAVLLECGFLSNADETARLKDEEYQKALAAVTLGALGDYIFQGS